MLSTIPAPGGGDDSGLAWAEGTLWVGQYRDRKIYQIDPETGVILRTIESNRFVTGVTWIDGELWHGHGKVTRANCDKSILERERFWRTIEICRPERALGPRVSDGGDLFFCGGGNSGKVRADLSAGPNEAPTGGSGPKASGKNSTSK